MLPRNWSEAWGEFDRQKAEGFSLAANEDEAWGDGANMDGREGTSTAQEETSVAATTKRTVSNLTVIFAIFGAISSIITVWGFFTREKPSLREEVHFSESFIPDGSKVSLTAEENSLWKFSSDLFLRHYCNKKTDGGKVNFWYDQENCSEVTSIYNKVTQSIRFSEKNIQRMNIDLTNGGTDVASNIKLRATNDAHLKVVDQSDKMIYDKDISAGDAVMLPNLNPSESLKITLDSSVSPYLVTDPDRLIPKINHSRGSASISRYRNVSPFFGNIADILDGIPKPLIVILFILICFMVTMAILLIVAAANALARGYPLSTIFSDSSEARKSARME